VLTSWLIIDQCRTNIVHGAVLHPIDASMHHHSALSITMPWCTAIVLYLHTMACGCP